MLSEEQRDGIIAILAKWQALGGCMHRYKLESFDDNQMKLYNNFVKSLKRLKIDFSNLTKDDAMLFPYNYIGAEDNILIWSMLYDVVPPHTRVRCINGNIIEFKDVDDDERYGMLAYMWILRG